MLEKHLIFNYFGKKSTDLQTSTILMAPRETKKSLGHYLRNLLEKFLVYERGREGFVPNQKILNSNKGHITIFGSKSLKNLEKGA